MNYKDISWLMEKVDVDAVIDRLGVKVWKRLGNEIWGWCPDHVLFTGREPSHPKWSLNSNTGDSMCFTEGRGSNLVYIVSRLLKITPDEAVEWILSDELNEEHLNEKMQYHFKKLREVNRQALVDRSDIKNIFKDNEMQDSGYEYFMNPPGKKPTLINRETVDAFGCVQVDYGRYANRVMIPFKNQNGEVIGFCATDILGEQEWLRQHPTLSEREYRKVLFSDNFDKENFLFGFDKISSSSVIITEGVREVMKLWQLGYSAVAVLGTRIHTGQLRVLAEVAPSEIFIMFDGDNAGWEASEMAETVLREYFDNVKVIKLPEGHDPKTLESEKVREILK